MLVLIISKINYVGDLPCDPRTHKENLKAYIEPFKRFSQIFSPGGLSNTLLSQGCIFETAPNVGMMVGGTYIPKTVEWVGKPFLSCPTHGSAGGHHLSMTSSNISELLNVL